MGSVWPVAGRHWNRREKWCGWEDSNPHGHKAQRIFVPFTAFAAPASAPSVHRRVCGLHYAPELLKEAELPQSITVEYVLPDGKTMDSYLGGGASRNPPLLLRPPLPRQLLGLGDLGRGHHQGRGAVVARRGRAMRGHQSPWPVLGFVTHRRGAESEVAQHP